MHAIEHTYVSLLADVSRLSGFSEIRGSCSELHWCLNEAPKLEKHVLDCIENDRKVELERFPRELRRLAAGSVMDPVLLRYLRQLLLFSYKAYVAHDITTVDASFKNFIDTNHLVGRFSNSLAIASPKTLDKVRRHCQSVLYGFRGTGFIPFHGPGAVTTSKERWQHRFSTIESLYPQSDWFSLYFNRDHCAQLEDCSDKDTIEAKVIAVPKDSRGPRLICVHPAEAIWIQQGLRIELERVINRARSSWGPWPKNHVNFKKQGINGKIALISSKSRKYATIDMKEASDRISDALVQILFGRVYKYLGCCRAQKYVIPKLSTMSNVRGDIHSYAPMGNATTFPVQSVVFWAICVASMQRQGFHQPGAAFVFGDDIIIPVECVEGVIDDLESFGLAVNRTKSFWRGGFRESCGVDAFNGVNVAPIRWKMSIDANTMLELQSLSDLGLRLRTCGYEEAACCVYSILRKRLAARGESLFKTNISTHGGIAEYTENSYSVWRDAYWHPDIQWYVSPVWRLKNEDLIVPGGDWNRILESITTLERRGNYDPTVGSGHDTIPTRASSRRLRLDRGWTYVG